MLRDLVLAIRSFRRGPFAAVGAACMLSSGLVAGLLTAGLAQTLLFRQVSATHGDSFRRIVTVDRHGRSSLRLSFAELQVIRDHLDGVGIVTAVNMQPAVVRVEGDSLQTMAEVVDGHYLSLTGTPMLVGRGLSPADDHQGTAPAVVISEALWRRRFGASPGALGQVIDINTRPFTIIGVAGASSSSSFLGASVDAWVPGSHADPLLNRGWRTNVTDRWFTAFVLPGTTTAEIAGRLEAASRDLARLHPVPWRDRALHTAEATVLTGSQRGRAAMLAAVLGGLSLLILAASASNVGGLLIARAAAARRSIAIHLAIGSRPGVILRQQLIEGAILGLTGAVIAMAIYTWARVQLAEIAVLPTLVLRLELPLDSRLVAAALAAGTGAGVLLALTPAVWSMRVQPADVMRDSHATTGRGFSRMRRLLVSAQVGLSLVLIVGASLFIRSLDALLEADLGFDRQGLVAMDFDVEPTDSSMTEFAALAREALRRAGTIPGVAAAAMSNRAPIDPSTPVMEVRAARDGVAAADVSMYLATADYFETVGIPILAGRAFTEAEADGGADVAIVNEVLADQLWGSGDVLGRPLYLPHDDMTVRVIGVARNAKYRSIDESSRPHFYRPTPAAIGLTLLARTSRDPREMLRALQQTFDDVGPGLVGFFPRTLDDHLAIELLPTRAAARAAAVLGTVALLFSGAGLYGLVSWFVELRRREIGIRMALGARTRDVRMLILGQALSTALPGMLGGLVLAGALAILARPALFGIAPLAPSALTLGIGLLAIVVIAAAYGPTRRATQIDPAITLRA